MKGVCIMAYKKNTNTEKKESYTERVMNYSGKEVKVVSCFFSVKEKTFSCKCEVDEHTTYNLYGMNASIVVDSALTNKGLVTPFFEVVESGNNSYLNVVEIA